MPSNAYRVRPCVPPSFLCLAHLEIQNKEGSLTLMVTDDCIHDRLKPVLRERLEITIRRRDETS